MPAITSEFRSITYAQEVLFGTGARDHLQEATDRFSWKRLMLCTSRSMRSNGQVDALAAVLGTRLVASYDQVQPHVQDVQVDEVLKIASQNQVEAIIGLGGGSPIGMAKAVASRMGKEKLERPQVGVIAIPTTYAGSEMTPVYGVTQTREDPPRKVTVRDPNVVPSLVIYDPELTVNLPAELTASTGINALAHCLEAMYSITRSPLSTVAAEGGVQHISKALFRCYQDGQDLEARTEMLLGAYLAGFSLASASMGLHHGLCHVLGGSASVPHGIANSIILPHAVGFNADATAPALVPAAEAMGISTGGVGATEAVEAMILKIREWISQMNLPQRLRDAGVAKSDLPRLAQLSFQNPTVQNNPKPITDIGQIERLLEAAW